MWHVAYSTSQPPPTSVCSCTIHRKSMMLSNSEVNLSRAFKDLMARGKPLQCQLYSAFFCQPSLCNPFSPRSPDGQFGSPCYLSRCPASTTATLPAPCILHFSATMAFFREKCGQKMASHAFFFELTQRVQKKSYLMCFGPFSGPKWGLFQCILRPQKNMHMPRAMPCHAMPCHGYP